MKYFYLLPIIALVILTGCSYTTNSAYHEVDAIYWHEGQRYTAKVVEEDGSITSYRIPSWGIPHPNSVKVYTDVGEGLKPWYNCVWKYNEFSGASDAKCEIHLHGLDELGTGGWSHGKFGSGSTTRIQ